MKFFIDTADIEEIKDLVLTGLVDGATTNPTLIHHSGRRMEEVIAEICELVSGPVSAEVIAMDKDGMLKEGRYLAKLAPNVVVKLPLTPDGLKACRVLTSEEIPVNITLCFSAAQALLAAKSGATFISPFVGRFDDIGARGMTLIEEIVTIYKNYPDLKTQVLVASIRSTLHVVESALAGADVATIPPKVFHQLYSHSLTEKGIALFAEDWKKTGQKILKD